MISFAVTRAQACMRGRLARSRLALEVAAATNIVSVSEDRSINIYKMQELLLYFEILIEFDSKRHFKLRLIISNREITGV